MKQLVCEMCGSNDLIKQDGVFVCQYCGAKYSVEEARKMMVEIEGTVEVTGTVKIDSADEIDNLLIRAKQFEEERQTQKAREYYNRILDIDANNAIAQQKLIELSNLYIGSVKVKPDVIKKVDTWMATNRKLDAIKYVREVTGLGLVDAKTWVENYHTYDLHQPQLLSGSTSAQAAPSKSGCYVATCVYGSYDCPQVWTLRRFRDDTLGATWYGRAFIRTYYAISPTLVKWFGKTSWFKHMWQGTLNKMVAKLNSKGVADTPYQDKVWR